MHLKPIPFNKIKIQSDFWSPRLETIQKKTIRVCLEHCEETGRIGNFRKAAHRENGTFEGTFFDDSDVYKVLEGAAYCLKNQPDPEVEQLVDNVIETICEAQQPDGYIYTYFTLNTPEKRWTDMDMHEDYCLGHLLEAGIAYAQSTGKEALLQCAIRGVKQMMSVFGPDKRHWVTGHQEIELALIRLYRYTGENQYLNFAHWLMEERGHGHFDSERQRTLHHFPPEYYQDNKPFEKLDMVTGHAVRAMYYFTAAADWVAVQENSEWRETLERIWNSIYPSNTYLTGGIGQSGDNEGFTRAFHKPNLTAYCETCAAIGMAMWNHRMNLLSGEAKYADLVETEMYNGILSGMSRSGDRFFYENPLASVGRHHRVPWFGCSCCPTNLCRFVPSVGGYAYALEEDRLYVNQFVAGILQLNEEGRKLKLEVETDYPRSGRICVRVKECENVNQILLRIPGWCSHYEINSSKGTRTEKGYLQLPVVSGDEFIYTLEMEPRRVYENPRVAETSGRVAVCRGPVVYCAEEIDNTGLIPTEYFHCDVSLKAEAALSLEKPDEKLQKAVPIRAGNLRLIPYADWDNREAGAMVVWMKEEKGESKEEKDCHVQNK